MRCLQSAPISFLRSAWLASALLIGLSATEAGAQFNTNLVANGNAETGTTAGFVTTGGFTVVSYSTGGGFPVAGDPGVSAGGNFFFAGGAGSPSSSGSQSFNVSAGSSAIDAGSSTFNLSAYLGGFGSQGDNAVVTLSFLSAASTVLGTSAIGPVTPGDRNNQTGLLFRSATGFVPAGTRSIGLVLQLTRIDGDYNDGYADNLSLVLTPGASVAVPGPVAGAGFVPLLGLAGAWCVRRRQKKTAA